MDIRAPFEILFLSDFREHLKTLWSPSRAVLLFGLEKTNTKLINRSLGLWTVASAQMIPNVISRTVTWRSLQFCRHATARQFNLKYVQFISILKFTFHYIPLVLLSWLPKETMWNGTGTVAGSCLDTFNTFIMLIIIWFPKAPQCSASWIILVPAPCENLARWLSWHLHLSLRQISASSENEATTTTSSGENFYNWYQLVYKKGCRCLPHVLSSKFHAANLSSIMAKSSTFVMADFVSWCQVPSMQGRFIDTPSAQNQW